MIIRYGFLETQKRFHTSKYETFFALSYLLSILNVKSHIIKAVIIVAPFGGKAEHTVIRVSNS